MTDWDTTTIEIIDRTPTFVISDELAAIYAEDAANLHEAWGAIREELHAKLRQIYGEHGWVDIKRVGLKVVDD